MADLAAADLPEAARQTLRALVYSEAKLYNEAATALAVAMKEAPHADLAVRLGNLYLGLGLPKAARLYDKLGDNASATAARDNAKKLPSATAHGGF